MHLLTPLERYLGGPDQIVLRANFLTKVPEGESCVDCKNALVLPYYYFFASKQHRCIKCAERENEEGIEEILRYRPMENSVLIFRKDTDIDLKRLRLDLQPQEELECVYRQYRCNGCSRTQESVQYVCLECLLLRREVLLCQNCVKMGLSKLKTASEHQMDHALLRRLYKNPYQKTSLDN